MNKCGPILLAIIWLPLSPQLKTHAADTAVAIGTPNTLIILADDKHKNEPKTFENCEEFIVQLGSQSLIDPLHQCFLLRWQLQSSFAACVLP